MSSELQSAVGVSTSATARRIIEEPGGRKAEVWPTPTDEGFLWHLLQGLFESHWDDIVFGPLVPGAAWEIRAPGKPERITLNAGYLTIDFGAWHFHLCIGGSGDDSDRHAALRRTGRAEFYRSLNDQQQPVSWGFRMFTQAGDQQISVLLPNPLLTQGRQIAKAPDWRRLQLWDEMRRDCLDLAPDPVDRSASGFRHG